MSCAVCTRYVCAVLFCPVKCNCSSQLSNVYSGQRRHNGDQLHVIDTLRTDERDVSTAVNSGSCTLYS